MLGQRLNVPGNETSRKGSIEDLPGHCECGSWTVFWWKRGPMLIEAREKERRLLLSAMMTKQIEISRLKLKVHLRRSPTSI